jgi:HK97 family phage prohead protease
MDKAFAHAEIKEVAEDKAGDLIIRGIASTGNTDRMNEVVDQNSLKESIKSFTTKTLFYMHSWDSAIGTVLGLSPGDNELAVEARVGKDFSFPYGLNVLDVNDVRKQIEDGVLRAFSIGFQANRKQKLTEEGEKDGPAVLEVYDLLELSVVGIPANKDCVFDMAKSFGGTMLNLGGEVYHTDFYDKAVPPRARIRVAEDPDKLSGEEVAIAQEILSNLRG